MSRRSRDDQTPTAPSTGSEDGEPAVHEHSVEELQSALAKDSLVSLLVNNHDDDAGVFLPYHNGHLDFNTYLQIVLQIQFDEDHGAPYWQEVAAELSFDPREAINGFDDLSKLPVADETALKTRPVTDFMPQLFSAEQIDLSKSSGTTGTKKIMPWRRTVSEDMARWYEWNVSQRDTGDGDWLVVGPYGLYEKHLEGAANRCGGFCHFTAIEPKGLKHQLKALESGIESPWRLLDPRTSLPAIKGVIRMRATREAAVDDLRSQPIEHIASAVPFVKQFHDILSAAETVSAPEDIRTILLSGTNINEEDLGMLAELYPNASLIPMYATSFSGVAFSTPATDDIAYYPMAPVTLFDVIDPTTGETMAFGERGRVVIHRVGEDFFWPNQRERETAICMPPPDNSAVEWSGIAEVKPLEA